MTCQLGLFPALPLNEIAPEPLRVGTVYQIILSAGGREYYITAMTNQSRARQYAAELQARHPQSNYHVREVSHRRVMA